MRNKRVVELEDVGIFREKLTFWLAQQETGILLDSCQLTSDKYGQYDFLAGIGVKKYFEGKSLQELDAFRQKEWCFGYICYEMKDEFEKLSSLHTDNLLLPKFHFFIPQYVFVIQLNTLTILHEEASDEALDQLLLSIAKQALCLEQEPFPIQRRITKKSYLDKIQSLKKHIARGDIYEINFCQEFYAQAPLNTALAYLELTQKSPMPFSAFWKHQEHTAICASPERYLQKKDAQLISQPIKGTVKRGTSPQEDEAQINYLKTSPKERAENIMIVDVVRNDFARLGVGGSVNVEELCEVYTFKQLHQMISTLSTRLEEGTSFYEILQHSFPMASMTGAPKIRAMELIEEYESSRRGLYSGSIGYFSPAGDFDFNVVIRSVLYNDKKPYLSFSVGGAITMASDPEKEYEECLLKAQAIVDVLTPTKK